MEEKVKGKTVEIPIAEDIAGMNLNRAMSGSANDPRFAAYISRFSPKWAKILFLIALIIIIASLLILLANVIAKVI